MTFAYGFDVIQISMKTSKNPKIVTVLVLALICLSLTPPVQYVIGYIYGYIGGFIEGFFSAFKKN